MLRKFANNASNANAVYRQSTRYIVVLQKKAGLVLGSNLVCRGWEFLLQLDNQSITTRNRMFISSTDMQKYGFYSTSVCISRRCVMGGLRVGSLC